MKTLHIPYTDMRLASWAGEPHRPRIVRFWIDAGYLNPEAGPTQRWDLLSGETSAPGWRLRSAGWAKSFWYQADCGSDEGAERWIDWSRRHPTLAADLWPRVVGFLRKAADSPHRAECYGAAAALMACVQGAEDAETYHERVAEWRKEWAKELDAQ